MNLKLEVANCDLKLVRQWLIGNSQDFTKISPDRIDVEQDPRRCRHTGRQLRSAGYSLKLSVAKKMDMNTLSPQTVRRRRTPIGAFV